MFIHTLVSTIHFVCERSVINVMRFSQIHILKEQEMTQLNGFYPNFCSHLKQVNGFHFTPVSTLHSVCRLRDINATRFFRKHNLKEPEITHTHRVEQNYDMDLVYSFCNILILNYRKQYVLFSFFLLDIYQHAFGTMLLRCIPWSIFHTQA